MASDCAGNVATECAKLLIIDKAKEYYSYITNYNENTVKLQKKYRDLMNLKETINDIVESHANESLKKATSATESWRKDVTKIENDEELKELRNEAIRKGKDLCCYGSVRCNLYQRYKMSKAADDKTKEIERIIHNKPADSMITKDVSRSEIPPVLESGVYVGLRSRDELMRIILNKLQDDYVDATGIVGMGAIGKTTLAKRIANKEAKDMFDEIVMAEISDVPNVERIQDQIAEQLKLKINDLHSIEERARILHARLKGVKSKKGKGASKILIILDNVWKKLNLGKVGIPRPFENTENFKCKLLVTSRESNVCEAMEVLPANIHSVKPLEDNEAKKLFREVVGEKTFDDDTNSKDRQEAVEKRLLKKCGGLPLTIVALANVLKNKESLSMWEHYANELEKPITNSLAKISDIHRQAYSILETSYEHIESEEKKRFFLLACLFPFGESIPVEELIRFGIGLYLFEHVNDLNEAKELANGWIDELKSSALLLEDNREGYVKIHDVVRASRTSQKGEDMIMVEAFPRWMSSETCQKYYAISLMSGTDHSRLDGLISDKLQILILDKTQPLHQFDDDFFKGMTNLKILILKGMKFEPGLPKSIGKLKMSLRTLHMEHHKLGDITGICELTNLLVLSLRGSTMDELPKDMGNLCKLRLLDLNDCQIIRNEIPANVLSKFSHLEGLYASAGGVIKRQTKSPLLRLLPVVGDVEWPMLTYNNNDCDDGEKSSEYASIIAELDYLVYLKVLHLRLKFEYVSINVGHQFIKSLDQFYIFIGGAEVHESPKMSRAHRFFRLGDVNNVRSFVEYNLIRELLKKTEMLQLRKMKELQNIFHDKDEFLNLQDLSVYDCENMKFIFLEHGQLNNAEFPNLKQMFLRRLPELESVGGTMKCSTDEDQQGRPVLFNSKMTFPSLEELILCDCNKIVQLWEVNCKQMTYYSSFQNLQKIVINECIKLEVFCSHSIATALEHLKEFSISGCPQLKDVISSKDETDIPKFGDHIFRSLENVSIERCDRFQMLLPRIVTHTPNSIDLRLECPPLKRITLSKVPKMETICAIACDDVARGDQPFFNAKMEFSLLEELSLSYCGGFVKLWDKIPELTSLEELNVTSCFEMRYLSSSLVSSNYNAQNLTDLRVEWPCLKNLRKMSLGHLPKLEALVGEIKCSTTTNDEQAQGHQPLFDAKLTFPLLETLCLVECNKVEVLCTLSIAIAFVKLKQLNLWDCPELREVITSSSSKDETDELPKFGDQIFPSLEKVVLWDCPKLQMFIAGNKTQQVVELSSLQTLEIDNCPEMESFASGPFKAPKLTQFKFDRHSMPEIKDINSFLEDCFQKAHNPSK